MEASGKRYISYKSRNDRFKIWNLSDIHWMSRACAEDEVRRDLDKIRNDPFSFWIGGGDLCDFIVPKDKRFDPKSLAPWVNVSDLGNLGRLGAESIRDLFDPIKEKCLGLCMGNHEHKHALMNDQQDLHGWICTELGVKNLGYSALFDVVFVRTSKSRGGKPSLAEGSLKWRNEIRNSSKSTSFRVFIHHGSGCSSTPGGKMNRLIQFMDSFRADIYFIGHVHDQIARRQPCLGADSTCTKLIQHDRIGLVSGSYLKTYKQGHTSYGEIRGYRPTSLGAAVVTIHPETRTIEAEI